MEYLYQKFLNSLKDLKHIEWFVAHSDQYEFNSIESQRLIDSLFNKIQKKNIFYSDIKAEYQKLVGMFENNPFNYKYDVLQRDKEKAITTKYKNNYFINISDLQGNQYPVAFQYLLDNPLEYPLEKINSDFDNQLMNDRIMVVQNFEALQQRYQQYYNQDVKEALNDYHKINFGKSYHFISTMISFVVYNYLLFRIVYEIQFFNLILHFNQYFSDNYGLRYSARHLLNGHPYLGLIIIMLIIYFIYLDIHYIYGLFYNLYAFCKYNNIYKHHKRVVTLYDQFSFDFKACLKENLSNQIVVANHRDNVYLPLLEMISRKYNFYGRKLKHEKRTKISVLVPDQKFYQRPISHQLIKLLVLLVLVEAICQVTMIIQ